LGHLARAFQTSSLRHGENKDPFLADADAVGASVLPDVKTRLKGRARHAGHDVQFRR